MPPARESMIKAIRDTVEPLPHVHAMWEGGAIAFGRLDEWSDIDLYVDTDDKMAEDTLALCERALAALAPIEKRFDPPPPAHGGYVQAFFLLKGTSPFLLVDLAIVRHSSPAKFLEPEVHGKVKWHFNKNNIITIPHLDEDALEPKLREKVARLRARAEMFWPFFDKWVARGDPIQAIDFYERVHLGPLVDVLRIKYIPQRHDFGTYYINHDLPKDVVKRLEALYFVKDLEDLKRKRKQAEAWFWDIVTGMDAL